MAYASIYLERSRLTLVIDPFWCLPLFTIDLYSAYTQVFYGTWLVPAIIYAPYSIVIAAWLTGEKTCMDPNAI